MSSPTLAMGGLTLVDRIFARRLATDVILVAAGASLVALATQLSLPLWPVPVTAQTLAVLLVGASLGAHRGALAMMAYAALGIAGLPIFSQGRSGIDGISGHTGGFIIGFIFAALVTGWLAQARWDRRLLKAIATFAAGSAVTFIVGLPWLYFSLGRAGQPNDLDAVLSAGFYPFILSEILKVLLAAALFRLAWRRVRLADERAIVNAE